MGPPILVRILAKFALGEMGGLLVKSKKSWWNKFNLGERIFYQDEINISDIIWQFGTYELVWKQYLYIGNISLVSKQMNIGFTVVKYNLDFTKIFSISPRVHPFHQVKISPRFSPRWVGPWFRIPYHRTGPKI